MSEAGGFLELLVYPSQDADRHAILVANFMIAA